MDIIIDLAIAVVLVVAISAYGEWWNQSGDQATDYE